MKKILKKFKIFFNIIMILKGICGRLSEFLEDSLNEYYQTKSKEGFIMKFFNNLRNNLWKTLVNLGNYEFSDIIPGRIPQAILRATSLGIPGRITLKLP